MVHVESDVDTCRQWNDARDGDSYSPVVFEDLSSRFERPDPKNRWDAPLFTIRPALGEIHVSEQVEAVSTAVTETSVKDASVAAAAAGASAPAATGRNLNPTMATERTTLACEIFLDNE